MGPRGTTDEAARRAAARRVLDEARRRRPVVREAASVSPVAASAAPHPASAPADAGPRGGVSAAIALCAIGAFLVAALAAFPPTADFVRSLFRASSATAAIDRHHADVAPVTDEARPAEGLIARMTREAAAGDPEAARRLGLAYARGLGVARDDAQARRWLETAATAGQADAQYELATMHDRGVGAPADPAEAAIWYLGAASQGHAAAAHNLGVAYAQGRGVGVDLAQAARWFGTAARAGVAQAQYNYAALLERGGGVAKDRESAYAWYVKAAETDPEAREAARRLRRTLGEKAADAALARLPAAPSGFVVRSASAAEAVPSRPATAIPDGRTDVDATVAEIQGMLTGAGYDAGAATGRTDGRTTLAIRSFQADRGLPVDGVADRALLSALRAAAARR